jgi:hypothetical protein
LVESGIQQWISLSFFVQISIEIAISFGRALVSAEKAETRSGSPLPLFSSLGSKAATTKRAPLPSLTQKNPTYPEKTSTKTHTIYQKMNHMCVKTTFFQTKNYLKSCIFVFLK